MQEDTNLSKFNTFLLAVIFIFSFGFVDFFRSYVVINFLGSTNYALQYLNVLGILSVGLLTIIYLFKNKFAYIAGFLWTSSLVFALLSVYPVGGVNQVILLVGSYMVPLLLLTIKLTLFETQKVFKLLIAVVNVVVFIVLALGIIDYVSGNGVQKMLLGINYFNERYQEIVSLDMFSGVYRYYSFFGHPLRIAQLFIVFFILNNLYNKYFEIKLNPLLISIVTLIGTVLSNSKVGVLLALILILFFNSAASKKMKRFYLALSIVGLIVLINTTFFSSTVVERISGTTDLSGGRTELVTDIIDGQLQTPGLLGGGLDYSTEVKSNSSSGATSFEYPLLMFSYDLGIVATVLMFLLMFGYPIYKMLMHKNYYLLFLFGIFALDVNSYNGLINIGDFTFQYAIVAMVMLNLNHYITVKEGKPYYKVRWRKKHTNEALQL